MASIEKTVKDKASKLKDKKTNATASNVADDAPKVFGSFGLQYPVTGIELDRKDGVTLINSNPEVRVFVCGGEITKDVVSVDIGRKLGDRGTCTIQLANPRGKYNININDLVSGKDGGLWREDKSIQATYDYDWLKKQIPSKFAKDNANVNAQSKLTKASNTILGKEVTSTITSVVKGISNMVKSRGKGFTQMVYEIKKVSNVEKSVGETVFDYRDPVYVFMKGRFSSYWYFAFTGFVEGIDDSFAYGSAQTITLTCHDVAGYLKRVRFLQQGTFLTNANFEGSRQSTNVDRITNIYNDVKGDFSKIVKTTMYAANERFINNVVNCHFSAEAKTIREDEALNKAPYQVKNEYYNIFREEHKFDTKHTDDVKRDNVGKQFREFKLINTPSAATTEKIEPLTINDIVFKSNTIELQNKNEAEAAIKNALQQIQKIHLKNTDVTWTIVGHCALICSSKAGVTSTSPEGKTSNILDFGKRYCTYPKDPVTKEELYNSTYDCIDIPVNSPGFRYGHGVTLSRERAKATKDLMMNIAKKEFADIVNLIDQMEITSVGNSEPRDLAGKKHAKSELDFAGMSNLTSKSGGGALDLKNMYVEIIPSVDQISIEEEAEESADFNAYLKDPHLLKFSPLSGLYYQLNEIDIDEFSASNLEIYYNTSVRYWVCGPGTSLDTRQLYDPDRTGWKHTHGFGVCGIHPALSYNFIDNFNILPDVHKVATTRAVDLDGATLTPFDIIKEHVIGVSTELTPLGDGSMGFQKNYFRPRIFVVRPQRFRNREAILYSFSEFTIDKENSVSTWDVLTKLILREEFTLYTSPMGDIFIEPLLHDAHPLEFWGKVETRAVAPRKFNEGTKEWQYSGVEVYFRTEISTRDEPILGYRKDYAYCFNCKANHPFFLSNKDIIRVTDNIKPENLVSHVIVEGSVTGQDIALFESHISEVVKGGMPYINFEGVAKKAADKIAAGDNFDSLNREDKFNVNLGFYLANGFLLSNKEDQLKVNTARNSYKAEHDNIKEMYNYKLKGELFQKRANNTIKALLTLSTTGVLRAASDNLVIYNNIIQKLIEKFAQNKDYIDKNITDINLRNKSITATQMTVLKNLAPTMYNVFSNLVEYEEKKAADPQTPLPTDEILKLYDITTIDGERGLFSITPAQLLNADYEENPGIDEKIDAFIKLSNPDLVLDGTMNKAFLNDFLTLVEITSIADSSKDYVQYKDTNSKLYNLKRKFTTMESLSGYLTKGDIKKYEELQIYNPAKDYLSKYGWNPGPRVKNVFLNNGIEAEIYAKILFDKINSNAFHLNCDVIGRPELMLNRPYYNEYKNTIGLCNEYSLSYSFGSFFKSNVQLNYLRRNAITYSYTEGNLDRITSIFDKNSGKANTNKTFNDLGINYLKSLNNSSKIDSRLDLLGSPVASTVKAVIKEVDRLKTKKLSKFSKSSKAAEIVPDGIYVAHDWVGHLSADDKIIPSEIKKSKLSATDVSDPKYISQLDGFIITKSAAEVITIKNLELHKSFLLLQQGELELTRINKLLLVDNEEIFSQQSQLDILEQDMDALDLSDSKNIKPHARLQRKWENLLIKYSNTNDKIVANTAIIKKLKSSVEKLIFQIYGVKGKYEPVSQVRVVNYQKDDLKGLMKELYLALPEKDLQKQQLRQYYEIVDDVYYAAGNKGNVKNFQVDVPIYFIYKSIDASDSSVKEA